jgi:MFS family permease
MNLPIGAAVLVFLYFVVEDTPAALANLPVSEKIARLDIYGTIIFVPCIVCLLLALQWGGQQYAWSDGRIITLLTLFGALLIVFILIQLWQKESATLPPRIAKQRTIAAGAFYSFTLGSAFMMVIYYLSIWFQAIKGDSAIRSGYSTLPFILSLVVASIFSGALVGRIGYYNPSLITGAILAPIGAGLLTLFKPATGHPMWIGIQVLFGFGVGMGLQQTNIAAQTVLDKKDAPTGISLVFFGQGLGGTISVAIGQNILDKELISGLSSISGVNARDIINAGATELRSMFDEQQLSEVLVVYNHAIVVVFYIAAGFACAAILGAVAMEWKSVKKNQVKDEKAPSA